jgi:ABC-2 type transport system permease protein
MAHLQIVTDASDPNIANTTVGYVSGIVRSYQASQVATSRGEPVIRADYRMVYNENLASAYMFVPGTMALILMLISALLTSISVTREKELGTLEVILLLGYFIFGLPMSGSIILLLAELLLYITLSLALGILISTLAKSQQNAMFISLFALMLPTVLLSGFIFPIENMPVILQWISAALPPRWFIIILKDIMLKGNGLAYVWNETLILMGMTALLLIAAIRKFSIRLQV